MPCSPREREPFELERLNSIKEYIDYLAEVYAREIPDQREDLTQESHLAVIRELRKNPACPVSHLKVAAKTAILEYRRRGRSVDGKLNPMGRRRAYTFVDLDQPDPATARLLTEVLTPQPFPRRVTEEQAFSRILLTTLRNQLTPEENLALSLRLAHVSWKKIGAVFGRPHTCPYPIRKRLETTTATTLAQFAESPALTRQLFQPRSEKMRILPMP